MAELPNHGPSGPWDIRATANLRRVLLHAPTLKSFRVPLGYGTARCGFAQLQTRYNAVYLEFQTEALVKTE